VVEIKTTAILIAPVFGEFGVALLGVVGLGLV
jgi:hypothetical protein